MWIVYSHYLYLLFYNITIIIQIYKKLYNYKITVGNLVLTLPICPINSSFISSAISSEDVSLSVSSEVDWSEEELEGWDELELELEEELDDWDELEEELDGWDELELEDELGGWDELEEELGGWDELELELEVDEEFCDGVGAEAEGTWKSPSLIRFLASKFLTFEVAFVSEDCCSIDFTNLEKPSFIAITQ